MKIAEIAHTNNFLSPRGKFFQDRVDDRNKNENDANRGKHFQKGESADGASHGRNREKLESTGYLQSKLRIHFEKGASLQPW